MNNRFILVIFTTFCVQLVVAQFTLDGQFRPRTEYRHGFGNLLPDSSDAGFAVSTRARLNAMYESDSYQFYLSIQDVLVWGENRQILPDDQNDSFAVFEAWANITLGKGWSTKLGRQVLSYDDQRIFGGLDWAQQGRNHDAGLIKYKKDKFMFDLGLAFSQDFDNPTGFQSVGTAYNTSGYFTYKTMQYVYAKQVWENFSGSILALNNGFQNFDTDGAADGVSNLQTIGTHLGYRLGRMSVNANLFLQTGERQSNLKVGSAYLVGLEVGYKATDKIVIGLGAEMISGDKADTPDKTEAFFPLYGTNHKFNGFMDYFYVGNHANSVGLSDIHARVNFDIGNKFDLLISVSKFSGQQELTSGEKALGTELDLVFSKIFNGYGLAVGYSQMFAATGMYELKDISEDVATGSQNWAWVMLTIKPQFLNTKKE